MENQHYDAVMKIADLEFREEFEQVADELGLKDHLISLPEGLFNVLKAHQEHFTGMPDFGNATKTLLEKINRKVGQMQDLERKSRFKFAVAVFCGATIDYLGRKFPDEVKSGLAQIESGLAEYANSEQLDREDLEEHAEVFKRGVTVENPNEIVNADKSPSVASFGFRSHLKKEQRYKLQKVAQDDYQLFKRATDFGKLFGDGKAPVQAITIERNKLYEVICLLHALYEIELIYPNKGGFWETLEGCIVDIEKFFRGKSTRKLPTQMKGRPGKKHAHVMKNVRSILCDALGIVDNPSTSERQS